MPSDGVIVNESVADALPNIEVMEIGNMELESADGLVYLDCALSVYEDEYDMSPGPYQPTAMFINDDVLPKQSIITSDSIRQDENDIMQPNSAPDQWTCRFRYFG
ncbi:unnamed protein product [Colias eurytheme]|nr:unnamed protein product [Colias eurytheme]